MVSRTSPSMEQERYQRVSSWLVQRQHISVKWLLVIPTGFLLFTVGFNWAIVISQDSAALKLVDESQEVQSPGDCRVEIKVFCSLKDGTSCTRAYDTTIAEKKCWQDRTLTYSVTNTGRATEDIILFVGRQLNEFLPLQGKNLEPAETMNFSKPTSLNLCSSTPFSTTAVAKAKVLPYGSECIDMAEYSVQTALSSDARDLVGNHDASNVQVNDHPKAPYSEFCETRPRGEKELWNIHKKIISYAVFAPDGESKMPEWVLEGFTINVKLARHYYPDWVVRAYTLNLKEGDISRLLAISDRVEVVYCHPDSALNKLDNARRMLTRFLAVDDPTIRYTMVRDVDSRFSPRELMAVNEWLGSKLMFHSMRDHQWHSVPIMGCCFGMKRGLLYGHGTTMTDLVHEAVHKHRKRPVPGCCGDDQNFLAAFVWPKVKSMTLDHDITPSRCRRYGADICREYPLGPRSEGADNHFVGAGFKNERSTLHYACNVSCTMTNEELNDWE